MAHTWLEKYCVVGNFIAGVNVVILKDLGIVYFSSDFLLPSIHIYGSYDDFNFGNLI